MLSSNNTVPPDKIEAEIHALRAVMQIMVGISRQEAKKTVPGNPAGKQLEPTMADNIAQYHMNHEEIYHHHMNRQDKDKNGEK